MVLPHQPAQQPAATSASEITGHVQPVELPAHAPDHGLQGLDRRSVEQQRREEHAAVNQLVLVGEKLRDILERF